MPFIRIFSVILIRVTQLRQSLEWMLNRPQKNRKKALRVTHALQSHICKRPGRCQVLLLHFTAFALGQRPCPCSGAGRNGRSAWSRGKKGELVRFENSRNLEMMDVGKDDRLSRFNDETDTTSRGSGHREIE